MRASRLIVCSHTPRMAKPASIVRKAKRDVQLQQLVGNVKDVIALARIVSLRQVCAKRGAPSAQQQQLLPRQLH